MNELFHRRLDRIIGPTSERRLFVERRHWLVLLPATALVVTGCLVVLLAAEPRTWLVLFAAATVLLGRWRHRWSTPRTILAVGLWVVPLWLTWDLPAPLFEALVAAALLAYLLRTIAHWWCEALVLTETSLWKISGILTTASPKVPLTQILFQDVRQNLFEQALGCGTLSFDTAGASDDPLARFGPVSDPFVLSARISRQRLRSVASRAGPPPLPPPSQEADESRDPPRAPR